MASDRPFRMCLYFLAFLQGSSLACIFPTLQSRMDKLGASFVVYGAAVGLYSIAGTLCSPIAGRVYSPKLLSCWQLVMIVSLFSLVGNIIFLVPSVPAVLVGRFFSGIVWAANPPAMAYLSSPSEDTSADSSVQSALSRFMTSQVIGYAVGPVFSAFISSSYSIGGFDFDVYSIAGCIITLLWVLFILVWIFMRKFEVPLPQAQSPSQEDTPVPVEPDFTKEESVASSGAIYRRITVLAFSNFVVVSVLLSSETLFAKVAEDNYGVSIQTTSLIFLGFGGAMAIIMSVQPHISTWYGNDNRFLMISEIISMLSLLLVFSYDGQTVPLWRLVLGYGVTLVFGGLSYALGYQVLAKMASLVPPGMLMGVMSMLGNFARFTSPLWVTAVYSRFGVFYDYMVNAAGLFCILFALLVLGFMNRELPEESFPPNQESMESSIQTPLLTSHSETVDESRLQIDMKHIIE